MQRRTTAALAATAGLAAVAAAARRRSAPASHDPEAGEPLGTLHGDGFEVTANDGTVLRGQSWGSADAALTVVLVHGYVLSDRCWHYQVRDLVERRPDLRVVTYDHRGHGRSAHTDREHATLQQLAADLAGVLEAAAPAGRVVLAGHSMGGMTLMALLDAHPELVGDRVAGAAFVSTSPGRLAEITYGLPTAFGPLVRWAVPALNERAKRRELAGRSVKGGGSPRVLFGREPSPAQVAFTLEVMSGTSAVTVADFHYTFLDHDRAHALAVLRAVPTTVLVGDRDVLCPVDHSRAIAAALPEADFRVFPGAGHMLPLERARGVSDALLRLIDSVEARAAATAG